MLDDLGVGEVALILLRIVYKELRRMQALLEHLADRMCNVRHGSFKSVIDTCGKDLFKCCVPPGSLTLGYMSHFVYGPLVDELVSTCCAWPPWI